MKWILETLEWLAKYGFIDIFFGLGILAYIREKFIKKPVHGLEGIDLSPRIYTTEDGGFFELTIKNVSSQPLYLYRTYLWPGYNASIIDKSTIGSWLRSLIFISRLNDKVPTFYDRRNTNGEYPLLAETHEVSQADSVFLQPGKEVQYFLGFELTEEISNRNQKYWDSVLESHKCGLFRSLYVHGVNAGILEIQL